MVLLRAHVAAGVQASVAHPGALRISDRSLRHDHILEKAAPVAQHAGRWRCSSACGRAEHGPRHGHQEPAVTRSRASPAWPRITLTRIRLRGGITLTADTRSVLEAVSKQAQGWLSQGKSGSQGGSPLVRRPFLDNTPQGRTVFVTREQLVEARRIHSFFIHSFSQRAALAILFICLPWHPPQKTTSQPHHTPTPSNPSLPPPPPHQPLIEAIEASRLPVSAPAPCTRASAGRRPLYSGRDDAISLIVESSLLRCRAVARANSINQSIGAALERGCYRTNR